MWFKSVVSITGNGMSKAVTNSNFPVQTEESDPT